MRAQATLLEATSPTPRLHPDEVRALTLGMVQGGDRDYRRFHDVYGWRLFRLAATLLGGDLETAEDIVQETMVRIVRHIRPFDTEPAFWNWLAAIVRNLVFDRKRARKRQHDWLHRNGFWLFQGGRAKEWETGPDPLESTLADSLDIALRELDPLQAMLLKQKYFEGWSLKEIARSEGQTVEAIESRLARARAKLKHLMQARAGQHHD